MAQVRRVRVELCDEEMFNMNRPPLAGRPSDFYRLAIQVLTEKDTYDNGTWVETIKMFRKNDFESRISELVRYAIKELEEEVRKAEKAVPADGQHL